MGNGMVIKRSLMPELGLKCYDGSEEIRKQTDLYGLASNSLRHLASGRWIVLFRTISVQMLR